MPRAKEKLIDILLIEDDSGDVLMIREALAETGIAHRISHVENGEDGITYLERRTPFETARRPDLILLDLNLPRVGGHEVLAHIKSEPHLRCIPVVVLSTSSADKDVAKSYDLHANAFVTKPADYEKFVKAVSDIDHFFSAVTTLSNR